MWNMNTGGKCGNFSHSYKEKESKLCLKLKVFSNSLSKETLLTDSLSCYALPNPQQEVVKGDQTSPSATAHYPATEKRLLHHSQGHE